MHKISAREAALDLLLAVETRHAYSQLVLNEALQDMQLSIRDRHLTTALFYGVLQRRMTLDYCLSVFISGKRPDTWVRILLQLSIYQKMFMDRIPDHAIVNEAVDIAKRRGHAGISGFVNAVLRCFFREGAPEFSAIGPEEKRLSVQFSHPRWLLELWTTQWNRKTALQIAESDNQVPHTFIRVNRTRVSRNELQAILLTENIHTSSGRLSADCLRADSGYVAASGAFEKGLCSIQDESSMLVADALSPEKGMTVLDACAGPGGKTTHLAERMGGSGKVVALDLHRHKTGLIASAAERLGLPQVETRVLDARRVSEIYPEGSFDRILLDVPCSGLGVVRRKPEIRWEKSAEDIRRLIPIQRQILEASAPLVKKGGRLVYSTCTVNREENDVQLSGFLLNHPEFEWDSDLFSRLPAELVNCRVAAGSGMLQLFPFQFGTDGFFIGCLKRKK